MMQLNRSGAATQPCLTPLEMVNQSERVLLMRTQLDWMCLCTVVLVLAQSWVGWSGECAIGNRGLPSQMQPRECTVFSEFAGLFSK